MILTVVLSCIGINVIAADQYIAIVLPGKMYKAEFQRRGLQPKNLSRVIEDSGTLTSPLVPWNTCGAYMAATLGVATLAYAPFVFLSLINPLVSIVYGYTGFTIRRIDEKAFRKALPSQQAEASIGHGLSLRSAMRALRTVPGLDYRTMLAVFEGRARVQPHATRCVLCGNRPTPRHSGGRLSSLESWGDLERSYFTE